MQVNWLLQGQLTGSVPVASICAGVTQRAVGEKLCAISSQFVLTLGLEGGGAGDVYWLNCIPSVVLSV